MLSPIRKYIGTSDGLSHELWQKLPSQIHTDPNAGFFRKWTGADVLHNGSLLELAGWKTTLQSDGGGGTSLATVLNANGGGYVMTTDNAQDDGVNMQLVGQGVDLQSIRRAAMEAYLKVDAVTEYQLFMGLATADTTLIASGAVGVTEETGILGLVTTAAAMVLSNQTGGSGVASTALTSTAATLTADTYVKIGVEWFNGYATAWINGEKDASYGSTEYPTGVVVPSLWFGANTTTARVFTMPWVAFGYEN